MPEHDSLSRLDLRTTLAQKAAQAFTSHYVVIVRSPRSGWKKTSEKSMNYMEAVLEVLLIWTPEQLDQNPWLLTLINGTIDLKTGEKVNPQRSHFITQLVPVDSWAMHAGGCKDSTAIEPLMLDDFWVELLNDRVICDFNDLSFEHR